MAYHPEWMASSIGRWESGRRIAHFVDCAEYRAIRQIEGVKDSFFHLHTYSSISGLGLVPSLLNTVPVLREIRAGFSVSRSEGNVHRGTVIARRACVLMF